MSHAAPDDLFMPVGTFMKLPYSTDPAGARAAVMGIPFDCGAHPVRVGSRMGPAAIRRESANVRPYQPPLWDVNPLTELAMVDCGDVNVVLGDLHESFRRIEAATTRLLDAGATPVTFGGDGAVTLPQLRAVAKKYPDVAVLHFDAHTDTYPDLPGASPPGTNEPAFNPATTFARAAEEGVLDVAHSIHVGARGTISQQGVFEFTRSKGFELITGVDMNAMGLEAMLGHIRERLAGRPVYLCWDMDFFDPSCAPGVFTPTWGGVTAREGLAILQALAGLDVVATDVNALSPHYDAADMSAFLAATCVIECIRLVHEATRLRDGG